MKNKCFHPSQLKDVQDTRLYKAILSVYTDAKRKT